MVATMNLPTTKQLRYFLALEKHGHFGKAAAACFVSQSAFSTAIRELESTLNKQLVDRSNKQVTITQTGRAIAARAASIIRELEELATLANDSNEPLSGPLNLGIIPTIAPFLLPRFLPALEQQYPSLTLYLREDLTARLYQQLMDGELDLILIALPYELKNVEILPLFKDPFYLLSKQGSQHVDVKNYAPEQLNDANVLLLEDGHCLRDHAISACKLQKKGQLNPFAATSLLTLTQMVAADIGVTFIPEMALNSPIVTQRELVTTELEDGSYRDIGLVWRSSSAQSEEFTLLGGLIKKYCVAK